MGPISPSKWYYVEKSDKHGAFLSRRDEILSRRASTRVATVD